MNNKESITMKKIFVWATALTMSFAFFSCDKENRVEPNLIKQGEEQQQDKTPRTLYTATSEMGSYDIEQGEEKENLRASIICNGYKAPSIEVSAADFTNNSTKAYWSIVGKNTNANGTVSNFLSAVPSKDNIPSVNSLVITKENDKHKLKMYAQVADNLDVKDKFAMLTLDGSLRDDRYIDYTFATRTNYKLKGLHKDDKLDNYHLPIMTDIMPFDKVFKGTEPVHYKPRGLMIALSVINNSCNAVTIKRIEFEGNNALWFEGSFDTWTADDGTKNGLDIKAKSSAGINTSYKAKFIGAKGDQVLSYDVYNGTTAGYKIDKELGQTIDDAVKEAATKFFVWGYPRDNSKQLKFKIVYTDYGQTTEKTKVCAVNTPDLGFQDGYAYQLPIVIKGSLGCEDIQSVSLNFTTALDFVAEMPAINKAGTGFVKNHCLPHTRIFADMYDQEVGYYTWFEAQVLFTDKDWLKVKYYLPNAKQARAVAGDGDYVKFHNTSPNTTVQGWSQVGEEAPEYYTSDYTTVQEEDLYVTYAIRFKGTKWESAWRYSYEGCKGEKKVIVKCVPLIGTNAGKTLDNIRNPDFFFQNKYSLRVFPTYAYGVSSDKSIDYFILGVSSGFWLSTDSSSLNNYGDCVKLGENFMNKNTEQKVWHFPVRPFRRP